MFNYKKRHGFVSSFRANCILWCSKKQSTIACSSFEVEYWSMVSIIVEITWLTFLLQDIGTTLLTPLNCSVISVFHMSINLMFYAWSKHIKIDYHFVHEKVVMGTLVTQYIFSSSQPTCWYLHKTFDDILFLLR